MHTPKFVTPTRFPSQKSHEISSPSFRHSRSIGDRRAEARNPFELHSFVIVFSPYFAQKNWRAKHSTSRRQIPIRHLGGSVEKKNLVRGYLLGHSWDLITTFGQWSKGKAMGVRFENWLKVRTKSQLRFRWLSELSRYFRCSTKWGTKFHWTRHDQWARIQRIQYTCASREF